MLEEELVATRVICGKLCLLVQMDKYIGWIKSSCTSTVEHVMKQLLHVLSSSVRSDMNPDLASYCPLKLVIYTLSTSHSIHPANPATTCASCHCVLCRLWSKSQKSEFMSLIVAAT